MARRILEGQPNPWVAYLPAAAVERHFVRETKAAFRGLAEVRAIRAETHSRAYTRRILDAASLLYIPGGNTYLQAQRLHAAGLMAELRQRLQAGLPLLAFSAGAVLCGPDILTRNDENDCEGGSGEGISVVGGCRQDGSSLKQDRFFLDRPVQWNIEVGSSKNAIDRN